MSESSNWSFPDKLQPKQANLRFDLQAAMDAVVLVRAEVPDDALTQPRSSAPSGWATAW